MFQLHRALHCLASVHLGHLTTGPFLLSMGEPLPSKKRSILYAGDAFDCSPAKAVPFTPPLSPPTSPLPVIGWLPCAKAVLSPLPLASCPTYEECPRASTPFSLSRPKLENKRRGRFLPYLKEYGYPHPISHEKRLSPPTGASSRSLYILYHIYKEKKRPSGQMSSGLMASR